MNRAGLVIVAAIVMLLSLAPGSFAYASGSLGVTVYANGYVHVNQVFLVDSKATSVQVPLLSPAVSDLVAVDQNGSPLSYGFAPGGSNITIYTLGAGSVTLRYDTNALTSKNGTVWTLTFTARGNSTVTLPQLSTLTSISGTPNSINQTNMSPELSLSSGTWKISYGVPLSGPTTMQGSNTTPAFAGLTLFDFEVVGVAAVAVAVGGISLGWRRRRGSGPLTGELRPDDVQVLNFIQEKGGRVLEPEIRMRFALPKTSAWRQIKRLERLGYVKVTKIGSQNQIEVLKDRNSAA